MRPKFFLSLVGSILALGLVMWLATGLTSNIALPVVAARLMETAPTPAPILKPPARVPIVDAVAPKQAVLDLSMQWDDRGDNTIWITNRNKATYHGLLLRLIVGADFTSWTTVLRD